MHDATAACHPKRSEAESKDPAEFSIDLIRVKSLDSWTSSAAAFHVERCTFRRYSREDVDCPIADINPSPLSRFNPC